MGINFRPWYRLPDTEDENQISTTFGDAELEIATHFVNTILYADQSSFST
jgi:hypothetical protein